MMEGRQIYAFICCVLKHSIIFIPLLLVFKNMFLLTLCVALGVWQVILLLFDSCKCQPRETREKQAGRRSYAKGSVVSNTLVFGVFCTLYYIVIIFDITWFCVLQIFFILLIYNTVGFHNNVILPVKPKQLL